MLEFIATARVEADVVALEEDEEELAALVAGAELELLGLLELLDAVDDEPHPATTRTALKTTVETTFERFTLSPTAGGTAEIAEPVKIRHDRTSCLYSREDARSESQQGDPRCM
jgi:hypothetical protein